MCPGAYKHAFLWGDTAKNGILELFWLRGEYLVMCMKSAQEFLSPHPSPKKYDTIRLSSFFLNMKLFMFFKMVLIIFNNLIVFLQFYSFLKPF